VTVLVSHRFSAVRFVDLILVVGGGESGEGTTS
jgi:ABC-type protease/lipase transport system fused ATPase/permease subunit